MGVHQPPLSSGGYPTPTLCMRQVMHDRLEAKDAMKSMTKDSDVEAKSDLNELFMEKIMENMYKKHTR